MSIRHPLILQALQSQAWAALPSTIDAIAQALHSAQHGRMATDFVRPSRRAMEDDDGGPSEAELRNQPRFYGIDSGKSSGRVVPVVRGERPAVAVLPVHGVISKYISNSEAECGGFDLATFDRRLEELAADPSVTHIVTHHNSPGGTISGVQGTSQLIRSVSESKPVVSWTDSQMCSASFWMGVSGTNVFCSEQAHVASIGVYMAWIDQAQWMEENGYHLHLFRSGKLKAATLPGQMDEAAAKHFQDEVDSLGADFRSWVIGSRALVDAVPDMDAMEGQSLLGRAALQANLVDGIYPTLNSLIHDLLTA